MMPHEMLWGVEINEKEKKRKKKSKKKREKKDEWMDDCIKMI